MRKIQDGGIGNILMNNLVSIIIPVYNVEPYIKRCIDSISSQTYKNLEIIVVDDGSKDNSASICEEGAKRDSRIKMIRKENAGAGYARNTGMDAAKGEYIFFVDSDDYIMPGCIERLLEVALKEDADIVKCSWIEGSEDSYSKIPKKRTYKRYSNISAFRTREMNIAVHGKLYKRSVVGDIRYPRETTFDDEFFTYKLIYNAPKIIILDEAYYYYYVNPNSIMRGKREKMPLQYIRAYEERIRFFKNKNEQELSGISHKEFAIRLMLSYMSKNQYKESGITPKELVARFKEEYRAGSGYAAGFKEKVSLFLFNAFPNLMTGIINKIGMC